jgi:hypothetical protein
VNGKNLLWKSHEPNDYTVWEECIFLILQQVVRQGGVGGMATRLWTGRFGVRVPVGERDLFLLPNVQTGSGAHRPPYSIGIGVFPWGNSGVKLTNHFRLVPRLRVSGAVPLLPSMPSWLGQGKLPFQQVVHTLTDGTSNVCIGSNCVYIRRHS